jgi:hypothetical protein
VGQEAEYEEPLCIVMDGDHQSKFVASNIEYSHDSLAPHDNGIRMGISPTQVRYILPTRFAGDFKKSEE